MAKFSARDNARREFSNLFVVGKDRASDPKVWGYIFTPADGEPVIVELNDNYLSSQRLRGVAVRLRQATIQLEHTESLNAAS